jgi:excisionase family DNA binding protein
MALISTKDAAARLGLSVRRVQDFLKDGRLPAQMIGGVYMINEKDLALVKNRKPGRPRKNSAKKNPASKT